MKRLVTYILALLSVVGVSAKQYNVNNIEMVHLQDETRYVCNPANILSWSAVASMDAELQRLEDSTGIEVVVVVVDSLENHDCYETAIRLGQKYGVGKKSLSNGLVILLSTVERCIQFSTGSGLEGYLTDVDSKRIQRDYMLPYFSEGDWTSGMSEGVHAVCEYLNGSMTYEDPNEVDPMMLIFVCFFLFIPILSLIGWWKAKKCPACGKHKLRLDHTEKIYSDSEKVKYQDTFICKKCGNSVVRVRTMYKASNNVRYNGGGRRGGGGFGGFGGGYYGGSRGGSFGGGHFGGGGAGSRF